ncbi:unnamed protein product [Caenorhabditis brenneri]
MSSTSGKWSGIPVVQAVNIVVRDGHISCQVGRHSAIVGRFAKHSSKQRNIRKKIVIVISSEGFDTDQLEAVKAEVV